MPVHRAADIQEQQHLYGVVTLGQQLEIEPAGILRRRADRVVEIQLQRRAFARELPETPQRELDVARAELDAIVEILELALVPHFDGAMVAALFLADAHAFGVVAIGSVRRGTFGADPFIAALVALLLLSKT